MGNYFRLLEMKVGMMLRHSFLGELTPNEVCFPFALILFLELISNNFCGMHSVDLDAFNLTSFYVAVA